MQGNGRQRQNIGKNLKFYTKGEEMGGREIKQK